MKLHFAEASSILRKTLPYIVVRLTIYAIIAIAAAIYVAFLAFMAKIFGGAGAVVMLVGLAILFGLLKLLQRYVLYMVKAGHIAVITAIIHQGKLPEGQGQLDYGKQAVTALFKELSVLFAVDQLVSGAIKAFNRMVVRVTDMIPIPGMESLGKVAGMIVNYSVTYVDETVLSFNLAQKDENIWNSAKNGTILYAQNWRPILKNAVGLALVNIVSLIVFIIIMLIPFGALAALTTNSSLKALWLFLALAFAYGLKLAFVDPFCLIATILTYNRAIEGQTPNPEWEQKLEQASEKFQELKAKAMGPGPQTGKEPQ